MRGRVATRTEISHRNLVASLLTEPRSHSAEAVWCNTCFATSISCETHIARRGRNTLDRPGCPRHSRVRTSQALSYSLRQPNHIGRVVIHLVVWATFTVGPLGVTFRPCRAPGKNRLLGLLLFHERTFSSSAASCGKGLPKGGWLPCEHRGSLASIRSQKYLSHGLGRTSIPIGLPKSNEGGGRRQSLHGSVWRRDETVG